MVDIQYPTAENRRGKKEGRKEREKREKKKKEPQDENIMAIIKINWVGYGEGHSPRKNKLKTTTAKQTLVSLCSTKNCFLSARSLMRYVTDVNKTFLAVDIGNL